MTALPTKLPPPKALLQPRGGERANAEVNDRTAAAAAMAVGVPVEAKEEAKSESHALLAEEEAPARMGLVRWLFGC